MRLSVKDVRSTVVNDDRSTGVNDLCRGDVGSGVSSPSSSSLIGCGGIGVAGRLVNKRRGVPIPDWRLPRGAEPRYTRTNQSKRI
jgi:hypothetical protein